MTMNLDELVTSARLSGRISLLSELRDWLDEKMTAAEKANKQMRENLEDTESALRGPHSVGSVEG